jgi:crotonobetainyl-CoA hydratase
VIRTTARVRTTGAAFSAFGLQSGLEVGLSEAMAGHYDELRRMVKSEDFIEGPKAFAEKRPPRWKGR